MQKSRITFNKLKSIDKKYSKIVHINNKQRLIRALEIYEWGKVLQSIFKHNINPAKY